MTTAAYPGLRMSLVTPPAFLRPAFNQYRSPIQPVYHFASVSLLSWNRLVTLSLSPATCSRPPLRLSTSPMLKSAPMCSQRWRSQLHISAIHAIVRWYQLPRHTPAPSASGVPGKLQHARALSRSDTALATPPVTCLSIHSVLLFNALHSIVLLLGKAPSSRAS